MLQENFCFMGTSSVDEASTSSKRIDDSEVWESTQMSTFKKSGSKQCNMQDGSSSVKGHDTCKAKRKVLIMFHSQEEDH